jgi:uncharacterized protein YecT (DUF1311 family)
MGCGRGRLVEIAFGGAVPVPCRAGLLLLCAAACGDAPPDPQPEISQPMTSALAPSFDCAASDGQVEELICDTPELAALDLRMDTVWQAVLAVMDDGDMPEPDRAIIRAGQRGWIAGRNDCWRSDDVEACVRTEYRTRTARLMAGFGLADSGEPTFWSCEGNPADEFVLTFFQTDPPSVRLERGDGQEVMIQTPAASGARYLGAFGKEVWVKGSEGTFVWPETDTITCLTASGV